MRTGIKFPESYAMFTMVPSSRMPFAVSMPMHHQPSIQGVPVTKTELIEKVSESSKISKKDVHAVIEDFLVAIEDSIKPIFRNTLPHQFFRTIEAR